MAGVMSSHDLILMIGDGVRTTGSEKGAVTLLRQAGRRSVPSGAGKYPDTASSKSLWDDPCSFSRCRAVREGLIGAA